MGRIIDRFCQAIPGAKLCLPVLKEFHPKQMNHEVLLPKEDVVDLPPLGSVMRSQLYYLSTRRILREFARSVDVLFIRAPFQLPIALRNLRTPKLVHVVGNPGEVVAASTDYRGLMRRVALLAADRSNATLGRTIAEPMTRAATNGRELWDLLRCRDGRVVVSSCISETEIAPRESFALNSPPRILFVGYLRPEKGANYLLEAFDELRRQRPLKLTIVGGSDRKTGVEKEWTDRIRDSQFAGDITMTGMLEFGQPLFDLYKSHDVYVLPSLSEGTPRTLVEARALGCPVVASRVGGIPSSVMDGSDGLLVPPRDPVALAAAIERVLDDAPLRQRLIEEGLRRSAVFSVEDFADQIVSELRIVATQK
jgi:glycosyltransferase involved in cell wall biosynthesis